MSNSPQHNQQVFSDIRHLIEETRKSVAVAVNAGLTMLYWQVGKRINDEVLNNERAEYGKQILAELSKQLTTEYGTGWSEQQLRHCTSFATAFPEIEILSALRRELTWTHFKTLIYITEPLKRDFYIEMTKLEK